VGPFLVRPLEPADHSTVVRLAQALHGWFTADGVSEISTDMKYQPGLVAMDGDTMVGFILFTANEGKGKLSWIGVNRDRHRAGAGRLLVRGMVNRMTADGITEVYVDTLGESVDYEPYARTRAFYRGLGFIDHKRIMQPGNEGMPERLVMQLLLPAPNL
jgi:ribosomal protein S18 acetylase RimI-like enzyme